MKNLIVLFIVLVSASLNAQESAYYTAMTQAMETFSKAQGPDDFRNAANQFSRIASAQDTAWLPDYYAAYNLIVMSFTLTDAAERDDLIAQAETHLQRAETISPANSEVEVLYGYAKMAALVVDPATRGQSHSGMVMKHYGKAQKLNPQNPRAVIMQASMEMGSAQYFGGDTSKICENARRGLELLQNEEPQGFAPQWGMYEAQSVMNNCKE